MSEEIWKDIEGYEGIYQVSSFGRVRSLDRYIQPYTHFCRGRILKPRKRPTYLSVKLSNEGILKCMYVHRLVAHAFIPNPNNLSDINHKDEDKTNNRVDNLEWCTHKYNINYGTAKERIRNSMPNKKVVIQMSLQGEFIAEYPSVTDAAKAINVSRKSIYRYCQGKRIASCGYKWKFK